MAHIKVIGRDEAEGRLREIYEDLVEKRGKLAEVHKIQSLNPESIVKHMDLYLTVMFGKSPLTRAQREMLGVVVSVANRCEYCQLHHGTALNHYWKDEKRVERLKRDYTGAGLSKADERLCDYAWQLTKEPPSSDDPATLNRLRAAGFEDRALLDATLVISYFNFVNRMVLGLGLESHGEEFKGYNYE